MALTPNDNLSAPFLSSPEPVGPEMPGAVSVHHANPACAWVNGEDPILKEELWSYIASYSSLQGKVMRLKDVCPCPQPPRTQRRCWVAKQWEKAGEMQMARRGDTSSPFTEAGFRGHRGCAPAPPNPSGALSSTEKSQVQGLLTQTNTGPKAVTFGRPGSRGEEKTPAHRQVGSAAAVLHLLQLQNACHCLGLVCPQNLQSARAGRGCLAPQPGFLALSLPLFFLHRLWGCRLVRLEKTRHHFEVIFLESKQHLTLRLFWWTARKVSCPVAFLVVATVAARHRSIFDCASNSLCFLLDE